MFDGYVTCESIGCSYTRLYAYHINICCVYIHIYMCVEYLYNQTTKLKVSCFHCLGNTEVPFLSPLPSTGEMNLPPVPKVSGVRMLGMFQSFSIFGWLAELAGYVPLKAKTCGDFENLLQCHTMSHDPQHPSTYHNCRGALGTRALPRTHAQPCLSPGCFRHTIFTSM